MLSPPPLALARLDHTFVKSTVQFGASSRPAQRHNSQHPPRRDDDATDLSPSVSILPVRPAGHWLTFGSLRRCSWDSWRVLLLPPPSSSILLLPPLQCSRCRSRGGNEAERSRTRPPADSGLVAQRAVLARSETPAGASEDCRRAAGARQAGINRGAWLSTGCHELVATFRHCIHRCGARPSPIASVTFKR